MAASGMRRVLLSGGGDGKKSLDADVTEKLEADDHRV